MTTHRVYRGIGVCRVVSSDDTNLVLEPITSLGTPPRIRIPRARQDTMTRAVSTPDELEEVLDLLRQVPEPTPITPWARRRRIYEDTLKECEVAELAVLLRDLAGKPTLSHAERVLRDRLSSMIADEVQVGLGVDRHVALALLAEARITSMEH